MPKAIFYLLKGDDTLLKAQEAGTFMGYSHNLLVVEYIMAPNI